jgi:CRP-like cAMP-binding protein
MSKETRATLRLGQELLEQLNERSSLGRRRHFKKNVALYEQGEISTRFYLVVSGLIQASIFRRDGSEVLLDMMGPGTICGEGAAFDGLPRFSTAVAVENSDTIEFDTSQMTDVFREHPEFASALLRVTSLKQRLLAIRTEQFTSRNPQERIMGLLNRLKEMFATDHPRGRLLVTHITHEQIGAMTAISRVTVTRTLQRLRNQGTIDVINGHILIRSHLSE